jgi:IQ domain-containing protein H
MTPDVLGYYMKILEISGEINSDNKHRVQFLVPENIDRFPHHFNLAQVLMYSPRIVKRLKSMLKGKQAYIVPGIVGSDDIKLSIKIQIPILSGEPQKQTLYSTKSGAKKIFQLADVPTPVSQVDIYDESEMLMSLAKLIVANLYVHTWVFKIDDEFNGRGIAILNLDSVKALTVLRKKPQSEQLADQIVAILSKCIHKKAIIPQRALYRDWAEYVQAFCRGGGIIEAAPNC